MKRPPPKNRREGRKILMEAIKSGDVAAMKEVLVQMPELVHARNSHHHTPLDDAVLTGCTKVVEVLLENGADGSRALANAAWMGHRDIADLLIRHGCEVTACAAAGLGRLPNKSAVNERDGRQATPLHHAARGNHPHVITFLLEHGADLHAHDRHDHHPISYAVENRSLEAAKALLENGANVQAPGGHYGGELLHRAILNRHTEMVELLLDHGAKVNHLDDRNRSPLTQAVITKNRGIIELLLRYGADATPALETAREKEDQRLLEILRSG